MDILSSYKSSDLYYHHAFDLSPSNSKFPMHAHEQFELFYHIRGKGSYMVEGIEYKLEPGCVMIVRPTETHKLYLDSSEPYERIAIEFSESIIRAIDPQGYLLRAYFDRPLGNNNQYHRWDFNGKIDKYAASIIKPDLSQHQRRFAIMINLFQILFEIQFAFQKKLQQVSKPAADISAVSIVEYVNAHLFEDLSLPTLCKQFYISQCKLSRIFKLATGASVAEYISIKRLFEARNLLKLGEPAAVVAKKCGFGDYSAFYRSYKNKFGIAPSADKAK